MHTPEGADTSRARSLDGLRGVAALVVLLGHVVARTPLEEQTGLHAGGAARWWLNTPIQMIIDGPDAVLVFFVLSGFVLLPRVTPVLADWIAYYPSRLIRLMVPVVASIVLAAAVLQFSEPWVAITGRSVVRDSVVLFGTDALNGPLWSLQWELWFSLALPAYSLFALWRPALGPVKFLVVMGGVVAGLLAPSPGLVYLSVFALGALTAVEYRRGRSAVWWARLSAEPGRVAVAVTLVVLAFNARALVAFPAEPGSRALQLSGIPVALGAWGLVVLSLHEQRLASALQRKAVQWVGARSFSIYLVHWPVVELLHARTGSVADGWLIVLAIPMSLAVAEAFYRVVERPSHQLARSVHGRLRPAAARGARPAVLST